MRALIVATVLLATASAHADHGVSTAHVGRGEPALVAAGSPARLARVLDDRAPPPANATTFATLAAAGWRARWDRDTGVVAEMSGTFVSAPGAMRDPAIAERVARAFITAHLDVIAPGADFVVVANRIDDGVRTVGFQQTYRGLRVVGAQLGVVFRNDHLFAITSTAIPNVSANISPSGAANPTRAEAWVANETGLRAATRAHRERVVLPIVRSGSIDVHVADVFDIAAVDAPGRWDVYVAPDGTPLARASTIADASATMTYNAGVRYAAGPRSFVPAVTAHMTVNSIAATTTVAGAFNWSGTVPATVVPSCHGTSVDVFNLAGADATTSISTPDGATVGWTAANVELDDAQISTYVYANIAIARARIINPAIAAWLAGPIEFDVNENNPCNAFSTGTVVHLARGVAGCENTGRVADIVFHEFGHSLHFQSIIAGMGAYQLDLSEGLADFNAANINDDSGIGRGLDFTDAAVREIDPPNFEAKYPDDVNVDTHITGEIISGALWDLRKALGVALTEKVFTGVMQRAPDIPGSYTAALIADDDNGDLGDLTPHYCAIYNAFGPHRLAPEYRQTVVSAPVVDQLAISVPVTVPTGTPCPPRHVVAMHVLWKVGDSIANELFLDDHDTEWTGAFPAQPDGTVLSYSVDITFDDGTTQSFPDNPADPMYQTFIGTTTPIYCQRFDTNPGWTLTGDWQWAAPTTAAARYGDPLVPYTGSSLLGTNVTSGPYAASESATAETTFIHTLSWQIVHLQYWRWLDVQDSTHDQAQIFVNDSPAWQNAGTLEHRDREWRFHDVELTPFITDGTVVVRWQLTSDASQQMGGWSIDDMCVVGMQKVAICGDGYVDYNEQCDDGNTFSGDGCSATCIDELEAGGGGCCSTGGGAGSPLLAFAVAGMLRRVRRSRAVR